MPKYLKQIQIIIGLWIVSSGFVYAALSTEDVRQITIAQTITLDAKIEAVHKTLLTAQTSGQIQQIFVDAGDVVPAGTKLLTINDRVQQANVNAVLAVLQATQADLNDATQSLVRIKSMYAKHLVAKQALDDATARVNISSANRNAAAAKLASAKQELQYTIVTAPYGGIVLQRHVNLGEMVAPGSPLFTGTSLENLRVATHIPQQDIEKIRRFADLVVHLPDGKLYKPDAKLLKFYAYADSSAATFKVTVPLPEHNQLLFPGMYVKAQFKVGEREVLVIPQHALIKRSELRAVYVLDKQQKLHLRQITVGDVIGDGQLEVLAGLSVNESVVLEPLSAIKMLSVNEQGAN